MILSRVAASDQVSQKDGAAYETAMLHAANLCGYPWSRMHRITPRQRAQLHVDAVVMTDVANRNHDKQLALIGSTADPMWYLLRGSVMDFVICGDWVDARAVARVVVQTGDGSMAPGRGITELTERAVTECLSSRSSQAAIQDYRHVRSEIAKPGGLNLWTRNPHAPSILLSNLRATLRRC